ncbi:hypothetical protein HK405_012100, partial [Cladochytrium tenue]
CDERAANLPKLKAPVLEASSAYEEITHELSFLATTFAPSLQSMAEVLQSSLRSVHSDVIEKFELTKRSIDLVAKLSQFAKKFISANAETIAEQFLKIESGDGWTQVLQNVVSQEADISLESISKSVDTVVRVWEDSVLAAEEIVDHLTVEGNDMKAELGLTQDMAAIIDDVVREGGAAVQRLQHVFEVKKGNLFELAHVLDSFQMKLSTVELLIVSSLSEMRQAMPSDSPAGGFPSLSSDSEDGDQRLRQLQESMTGWSKFLTDDLEPASRSIEVLSKRAIELSEAHVGGSSKFLIAEAVHQSEASFKASLREFQRVFTGLSIAFESFERLRQ